MPRATSPAPAAEGVEPASPAPDWDNVPFDVGCARCGHDLRGLNDPKCPTCGLEFDWQDAVPIERLICLHCGYHLYGLRETRCPECGEPFTWEEVLAEYHRRRKPLFEYRWREEPVRSLVRTWFKALRPGRFWRTIDIHDPPPVHALALLWSVAAITYLLVPLPLSFLGTLVRGLLERATGGHGVATLGYWYGSTSWKVPLWFGVWSVVSFAALLILRQSMAQCRVRVGHVLRVHTYAMLLAAVGPSMFVASGVLLNAAGCLVPRAWVLDIVVPVALAVLLSIWFGVIRSVALGCRDYIQMRHAWGVALASQLIAVLGATTVAAIANLN